MLKKTIQYSSAVLVLYAAVSYILVHSYQYNVPEITAFTLAGALALLNLFLTVFFIDKNLTKNQNEFMKSFLQSTIIRLIIILAIFFTILVAVSLNHFVFGIGFLILYFLFQMIEIYILHTNKHAGK